MPLKELLVDIIPRYARLSKNEAKILDTIIAMKSGNAYGLWKTSGLKHYPTVLRTVKKLEEKRLVQVLSESGTRGERIYIPTLFGTLLNYALREEENRLIEVVSLNSRRFQELLKSKIIEETRSWVYSIVRRTAADVVRGELRTIDDIVKDIVLDMVRDNIINLQNPESKNKIIKLSKIEWIRGLTVEEIEREIKWCKKQVQGLKKLKTTLTTK